LGEHEQLKVVLCWTATDDHLSALRSRLQTDCAIAYPRTPEQLPALCEDADVLVAGFGATATKSAWQASRRLKLIHSLNVGVENIEALPEVPVPVANVSRAHSVSVAEHAVALLLAWCKNIVPSDVAFKEDRWLRPDHTKQLYGKTAGIVGLGNIGLEIAHRMKAFGCRVIGTKRHVENLHPEQNGVDRVFPRGNLKEVLAQSHFVFIACPLLPETEGLIGPEELGAMKADAVLVNIARAPVVQEEALYTALTTGQIAGACLDVWYFSAPGGAMFQGAHSPSRYPINRLPNVVASPHLGYKTPQAFDRVWSIVADNIDRLARGQPLTNLVSKQAGY
jgi:phosphoglycerate dehydrogenase-like enzyme